MNELDKISNSNLAPVLFGEGIECTIDGWDVTVYQSFNQDKWDVRLFKFYGETSDETIDVLNKQVDNIDEARSHLESAIASLNIASENAVELARASGLRGSVSLSRLTEIGLIQKAENIRSLPEKML